MMRFSMDGDSGSASSIWPHTYSSFTQTTAFTRALSAR